MNGRIALISEHASPLARPGSTDCGGQNVYVFQIAKHLDQLGFSVDVFTRRDCRHEPAMLRGPGKVRVWQVDAGPAQFVPKEELLPYMPEFGDQMLRHCRAHGRFDLMHANFWMSGLVGCRLKRALRIPLVTTFHALGRVRLKHQGSADRFPRERLKIEERVVIESDRLIAECPQDERDQIELYRADPAKVRVVGCGFDPSELWPVDKCYARSLVKLPQDQPLVLQIGRLVPRKGVDNVIQGFAKLIAERGISARLAIVGGESEQPDPHVTPEIGRLTALAQELGVADRVIFTGRRDRKVLRYYYSAADAFVTTPWYEPFGITPLEAMACGTPVIGSNVGGIKYTVRDGETGFLVPPRDPATLADRLALLLGDAGLLERMGNEAIERVNRSFTWRHIAASIAGVYQELIRCPKARDESSGERLSSIPAGLSAGIAK
ncbi:MAG TPA: glycosyltransferase family 1 protein [Planctomycetaceae bacterium]|nr:glycosyltransferase family 1 protein [Planctomycetaceae bacterium]